MAASLAEQGGVVAKFILDGLRSVELGVTDVPACEQFFTDAWGLAVVARDQGAVYLRGTGADHHLIALHPAAKTTLRSVTFSAASKAVVDEVAARVPGFGATIVSAPAAVSEPGGGYATTLRDPDGRLLRVITGDARHADAASQADRPERIAHVVFNAPDPMKVRQFLCDALGFRLSDQTRIMHFVRTSTDHHSIAIANGKAATLNHIAFLMPDLDSVMRGAGRLRDKGYEIQWGVGRHGPGNNVFAYFVGPDQLPVEYTAEVSTVDDDYRVGKPEDWTWLPGRIDHWGISAPPTERLKEAQNLISFA
jgi:catechol 2,3-dioxygenase